MDTTHLHPFLDALHRRDAAGLVEHMRDAVELRGPVLPDPVLGKKEWTMVDAEQGFSKMFRSAIGHRLAPGAESIADIFADDAVVEFPFAPPLTPDRLAGKSAVVEFINTLSSQFTFDRFGDPSVQITTDPDLVVAEFEVVGTNKATGEPYNQLFVSFIRSKGGKVVHYREYLNPLVVLRALKGSAAVDAVIAG